MKNIHILPTDKPSKGYVLGKCIKNLSDVKIGQFTKGYYLMFSEEYFQPQNIYITSDEEIKEGDWFLDDNNSIGQSYKLSHVQFANPKKIILTTDFNKQPRVQAIDDEFLEWFVKNPSCEEVEIVDDTLTVKEMSSLPLGTRNHKYKIIIPKEIGFKVENGKRTETFYQKPKQETLEEVSYNYAKDKTNRTSHLIGFRDGAKWQEQQTIEEVFEWLTTNNYLTDLKETLIENFKNK